MKHHGLSPIGDLPLLGGLRPSVAGSFNLMTVRLFNGLNCLSKDSREPLFLCLINCGRPQLRLCLANGIQTVCLCNCCRIN